MSYTRILLSGAILFAVSVSTASHAQEEKQPIASEPYLIDQFLPKSTALKKGYFITEGQLESLSPEARAEIEKLLKQKAAQATSTKVDEQKVPEEYGEAFPGEYGEAYKALTEALEKQDRLTAGEQRYRYMIGVTVEPNEGNDEGGVIVSRVLENSPAETAGVAPGDVILFANGPRRISSPQDLIATVEASEGKEIVLHVKTYGKEGTDRSLKIVPMARPEKLKTAESERRQSDAETRDLSTQALKQYDKNDFKLRTIHPGIYWDAAALQQNLPENVTITISKTGKAPARISVKRNAESWNMDETEVDQLPEELRAPVKRLLTRPRLKHLSIGPEDGIVPGQQLRILQRETEAQLTPATQATTAKELQQIQQQLEALQKAVDKLQQDQKQE